MDVVDLYRQASEGATELIDSLQPADLARPTPCEGWDVRALLNHMVTVNLNFAANVSGEGSPPARGADVLGDDPAAAYRTTAQQALRAWQRPGALDGTVTMTAGPTPARTACGAHFVDALQHVWDLDQALGRPYTLDPALAEAGLEISRQRVTPDRRGPGKPYGPEAPVAADAPLQDRLAAFLGRQP